MMTMPQRNNRIERSPPDSQTQQPDNFSMKPLVFPPGFNFTPTDEELIFHYLKPFFESNQNLYPNAPIHYVNIYKSNPDQLTKNYEKGNDKEWFFITERSKIREGGKKVNRSDNGGFWKPLTALKKIEVGQGVVGYKTLLDYRNGNGVKAEWLMHEYWFESSDDDNSKVDYALCKIFLTPRVQKRKAVEEEKERRWKKVKEEAVAIVKEEVDQPCNAAFQQPEFQPYQSQQPHDYAYQPQKQLQSVVNQPPQPQIFLVKGDLLQQTQLHNVATVVDVKEEEVDQSCITASQKLQVCEPTLDLYQPQQSLHNIRKQLHNVATVIDVDTVKEKVDQPCNATFQPPLNLCQSYQPVIQKLQNYAYQPQQQLNNVDANQPPQPQIFLVSRDSLQLLKQEEQQLLNIDISDELS